MLRGANSRTSSCSSVIWHAGTLEAQMLQWPLTSVTGFLRFIGPLYLHLQQVMGVFPYQKMLHTHRVQSYALLDLRPGEAISPASMLSYINKGCDKR